MATFWDGSNDDIYNIPKNQINPWKEMVNRAHKIVSQYIKPGGPQTQPYAGETVAPGSSLDKKAIAQGVNVNHGPGVNIPASGANLKGASGRGPSSASPLLSPVSHPGTKHNFKAGVAQGGHSTTHPPTPATSHASPDRHTRPPHAVSKATGGTQHTHSSGSKAGHPAAQHKTKIGHAASHHKTHKTKKTTKKKK